MYKAMLLMAVSCALTLSLAPGEASAKGTPGNASCWPNYVCQGKCQPCSARPANGVAHKSPTGLSDGMFFACPLPQIAGSGNNQTFKLAVGGNTIGYSWASSTSQQTTGGCKATKGKVDCGAPHPSPWTYKTPQAALLTATPGADDDHFDVTVTSAKKTPGLMWAPGQKYKMVCKCYKGC